jgi:iron complex outermembrane recepter protein
VASNVRARAGSTAWLAAAAVCAALLPRNDAFAQIALPQIDVIGTSPLAGPGIERDKVPAMTHTLTADDFQRTASPNVTDTLMQRVPGVSLSDPQGNGATQDLRYRGFAASPLQGTPQGLAVYMNGIRVNEAFGDTVNWDLIPTNAVGRADLFTSNPIFGLNALGGAVSLQMKNGFTYSGFEAEASGGSFGRVSGGVQYGAHKGDFGVYFAAQGHDEKGWRYQSPTELARMYGDIGWRNDTTELHFIASAASNFFGVINATPVELLARDYKSIWTWPQTTRNDMGLVALTGKHALADTWVLNGNLYVRDFRQRHLDGNAADIERCSNASSFPNRLCLQDDGFPRPNPVTAAFRNQFVLLDPANNPISCPPGAGNTCASVPWATLDRTRNSAVTVGGSLQATNTAQLFGRDNQFTVGGSVDHSRIVFTANSTLAYVFPNLQVGPNSAIPGEGSIIHTAGNFGFSPVSLGARTTYSGFYATDTFDVTPRLSATAGARLNVARVSVADVLGTSPDLNNDVTYTRLNPTAGLAYKITPGLTAYAGYAEANRAPTPVELGCSNPAKPCLLESFVVSDPPLKQVVGRTIEAGLRGDLQLNGGRLEWKAGAFRAELTNDIINVASFIQGRGSFQNVAGTRRQGLEAGVEYKTPRLTAYASYSYIDATFRFTGDISSPNNPGADAEGNIHVVPGDRIPMIPQHQFKAGLEYAVTPEWKVGGNVVVVGSQFYAGDEANLNEKLPAYWVVNLRTSYDVNKDVQVFALVNNLFNNKYALFGTYFETQAVANAGMPIALTNPRMQTPAQPLAVYGGVRVRL